MPGWQYTHGIPWLEISGSQQQQRYFGIEAGRSINVQLCLVCLVWLCLALCTPMSVGQILQVIFPGQIKSQGHFMSFRDCFFFHPSLPIFPDFSNFSVNCFSPTNSLHTEPSMLTTGTSSACRVGQGLEESAIRLTTPWSKKSSMHFVIQWTISSPARFWVGWCETQMAPRW